MNTTCSNCSQDIEIDGPTLASLQGTAHFECPTCQGAVSVPPMPGRTQTHPRPSPERAPSSTIAQTHKGMNRNLLVLGVMTLLVLGGIGAFLASRNGGNIFNTFNNITNQIIHNSYFTQLIASGATTMKDLKAIAEIRPYGDGFIGISKEALTWEQARELAKRTGSEILPVDSGAATNRQKLLGWLATSFNSHLSSPTWVRERGDARVLDGPDVLAVTALDRPRKAFLQWGLSSGETGVGWVSYLGGNGPGKGKRVVLLAGDEEYRSEEALPMLGKLLSERHGFKCTVVFSINKQTGEIDPSTKDNEPGIDALDSADLCIISLRYRAWPDEQMKHFARYVAAGKPIIGLRTSTHAFMGIQGQYAAFNSFGREVLGEKWVNHWGKHGIEATLGVIEQSATSDPLLRGVGDIFGTSDVYEVAPPTDANILVRGLVLKGLRPNDPPADYKKKRADNVEQGVNDPAMPIVWRRKYAGPLGNGNPVLCTTMGAATDFENEGLRRLIVNATYVLTGLEVPAKADVTPVGEFKPSMFQFNGFIKGRKPADHALGR